jgi:hypothetical protein
MSQFDVAAGITNPALNDVASYLFNIPAAKQIFNQTVDKKVDNIGNVHFTVQVNTAPQFILTAPTDAQWSKAIPAGVTRPTTNAFQLLLSDVKGSISINSGKPLEGQGALTIYGHLTSANGVASLVADAVYMDESSFSVFDKWMVNQLLVPAALKIANQALSAIPIPKIPSFAGLSFQPVTVQIINQQIVSATALTGGQLDLTGYQGPPNMNAYILATVSLVNKLLANEAAGKTFSESDKTGSDSWYAAGKAGCKVNTAVLSVSGDAYSVAVDISDITASGEIGGTGVGITKAILCPIGAAADAIANPSSWDKMIASYKITYSPDPLRVGIVPALADTTADGKTVQVAKLSINEMPSIHVLAQPTWSKSVTGSFVAAATSALVDMIPALFQKMIVNRVIRDHLQNLAVYTLPDMSATVEGVTVTLYGTTGNLGAYNGMLANGITGKAQ